MTKIIKQVKRGFTLIELLVVISIIALLSTIVMAGLKTARDRARNTAFVEELMQVRTALYLYRDKYGVFPSPGYNIPTEEAKIENSLQTLVEQNFIPEIPTNPDISAYYFTDSAKIITNDPSTDWSYDFGCNGFTENSVFAIDIPNSMGINLPKFCYAYGGWTDDNTFVPAKRTPCPVSDEFYCLPI